jgi:hypothetical protein
MREMVFLSHYILLFADICSGLLNNNRKKRIHFEGPILLEIALNLTFSSQPEGHLDYGIRTQQLKQAS